MPGLWGGVVMDSWPRASGKLDRRLSLTAEKGPVETGDASSNLSSTTTVGSGTVFDLARPGLALPRAPLAEEELAPLIRLLSCGEVAAYSGRS